MSDYDTELERLYSLYGREKAEHSIALEKLSQARARIKELEAQPARSAVIPEAFNVEELNELKARIVSLNSALETARAEVSARDADMQRITIERNDAQVLQDKTLEEQQNLQTSLDQTREKLNQLEAKVTKPQFWKKEFVEPFAFALHEFNDIGGSSENDDPQAVRELFQTWHGEIEAQVIEFATNGFDLEACERLRRILLLQWVYLRWLEIREFAGR
jgi:DNA repair exonuclease SbcCD ATPase subunit